MNLSDIPTPETEAVMQDKMRDGNDLPNLARSLERRLGLAKQALEKIYTITNQLTEFTSNEAKIDSLVEETLTILNQP